MYVLRLLSRILFCFIYIWPLQIFTQDYGLPESYQYTLNLERFTNPRDTYDTENASALEEINFFVSQASADRNSNLPPPPGFDIAYAIRGKSPITSGPIIRPIFAYIFVSESKNMVVLSFTATQSILTLISDLIFVQVPPTKLKNYQEGSDILVERGFYHIYLAVRRKIKTHLRAIKANIQPPNRKNTQYIITGHSLGGALSTLASFDLNFYKPYVYNFGAPRVGNPEFVKTYNSLEFLNSTWRVFNTEDLVPTLPVAIFPIGVILPINPIIYEHIGNPVAFTLNLGTLLMNHIEAYRRVIIQSEPPSNPNGLGCCQVN